MKDTTYKIFINIHVTILLCAILSGIWFSTSGLFSWTLVGAFLGVVIGIVNLLFLALLRFLGIATLYLVNRKLLLIEIALLFIGIYTYVDIFPHFFHMEINGALGNLIYLIFFTILLAIVNGIVKSKLEESE